MQFILFMKNTKLITLLLALLVLNLTSLPDRVALNYIDDALATSATAYVAARGINATISVLQDVEISVGIASVSPGELLDPLNDLIERFSTVMLYATASLGIQKILLTISGWLLIKLIVVLLIILLIIGLLFNRKYSLLTNNNMGIIYKLLIFLLALRFCVPVMAIANGAIENIFINNDINVHVSKLQKVEATTKKLAELNDKPKTSSVVSNQQNNPEEKQGNRFFIYLKRIKESLNETADALNPNIKAHALVEQISKQSSEAISSATKLMSLFIAQSILLPLLFLYIVLFSVRQLYQYELFRVAYKSKYLDEHENKG